MNTGNAIPMGPIMDCFSCGHALARVILGKSTSRTTAISSVIHSNIQNKSATGVVIVGSANEIAHARNGRMTVLHHIPVGNMFGYMFGADEEFSEVIAIETTSTIHIAATSMIQLVECYPSVALALTGHLARRLAEARGRMISQIMLSSVGRVCAELQRLASKQNDNTIRPMPVLTELALTVNATRETVSRTISRLEARGIVKRLGDGLRIVAPHRLDEMIV